MAQRIPLAPGAFAGDYEIIRLLSEFGGSALVYYARRNDRLYVLKELYPAGWARRIDRDDSGTLVLTRIREQDWANHLQQFEAEAVNYTLLQREFGRDILPGSGVQAESAYTFFCEASVRANGTCYLPIVTSSGETLYSYALKHFTCGGDAQKNIAVLSDIVRFAIGLCEAMIHLHGMRRLHLDLKPHNLFISGGRLKLLDFGSMVCMDDLHIVNAYTPGFSAPEMGWGRFYLDADEHVPCVQSDVFSICAILYWMIFGEPRSEDDLCYGWELNLSQMDKEKFPPLLLGCNLSTIKRCLSILSKGMSMRPKHRHESVAALKADLEALSAALEDHLRIESQRFSAAAFMDRIHDVYAFRRDLPRCADCIDSGVSHRECLLTCRLMNRYIDRSIRPKCDLIVNETPPRLCLDHVHEHLIGVNQYAEALFTLQFLLRSTCTELWHPTLRCRLYEMLAQCASLLGNDALRTQYSALADQYKTPDMPTDNAEFNAINIDEGRLDFPSMVEHSRTAIMNRWGGGAASGRDAVREIILSYDPAPKMLVSHAGRYVEGMCLARSEGWREDGEAILSHLLLNTEHVDEGFRARTVDNMLHFSVETGNCNLFLKTLPLLPEDPDVPESLLRPSGGLLKWKGTREPKEHVTDWLIEAAEGFSSRSEPAQFDSYQYILYLYLQSVNALFGKYLKKPGNALKRAMTELCENIDRALLGRPALHPKELILKHAALIAHTLGAEQTAQSLRAQLAKCIADDAIGVVRVISGAALLTVDRAMGNRTSSFDALKKDIESGIEGEKFLGGLFSGAMDDPDALLSCFRFKHT